jgi:Fe-S oxidoreductase
MICCGIAVKRMGMFRVFVRKMKALIVKMKRVTLIGKGR